MMDLLEAIRLHRPADITFGPDPIAPEHLRLLVESAARSPSHFNSQPWRFVLVHGAEHRARISACLQAQSDAPAFLAIALNKAEYRPGELQGLYSTITLGAVVQTFSLVAAQLSIGLLWCAIEGVEAPLTALLTVPDAFQLVILFGLGYRLDTKTGILPVPSLASIAVSNTWGTPLPETVRHAPSLLWETAP